MSKINLFEISITILALLTGILCTLILRLTAKNGVSKAHFPTALSCS